MLRDGVLVGPEHEHAAFDLYPLMNNFSAGFLYQAVIRAEGPASAEYVTVPIRTHRRHGEPRALDVAISEWNALWESGQFRRRPFDEDDLPVELSKVADRGRPANDPCGCGDETGGDDRIECLVERPPRARGRGHG